MLTYLTHIFVLQLSLKIKQFPPRIGLAKKQLSLHPSLDDDFTSA